MTNSAGCPRVPLVGTLELLIREIRRLTGEAGEDPLSAASQPAPLGAIRPPADHKHVSALTEALGMLLRALPLLENGLSERSSGLTALQCIHAITDLDTLDEEEVRYPTMEGMEGLARLVENGIVAGPVLGAHLAAVLRKEKPLKKSNASRKDGRFRRFAVIQVATIKRLWSIGEPRAVEMFCDHWFPNDAHQRSTGRVQAWVKRAKKAVEALDGPLPDRERRHCEAVLKGLHSELRDGCLKGEKYPEALKRVSRRPAAKS